MSGAIKKCSFVASPLPLPVIVEKETEKEKETETEKETEETAQLPPPPPPPIMKTGITKLLSQIYAPLKANDTTNVIANDVVLDKQLIITGPNAAGKTTVIKTTLFNIILSQQIGYGFYQRAEINPYDYLHCYLNIPDTSGRDSLFQAESRRCMEILRCIIDNPKKRHFCIFDELYSGTNPYEAVAAAYGYIDYISKNANVDLILTTHYIELCELLEKNGSAISNLHMSVSPDTGAYLYKIATGISTIKGGLKVLRDLEYPDEIVESAKRIIEKKN
jgi:DNA mismatch repair ATPase MutS